MSRDTVSLWVLPIDFKTPIQEKDDPRTEKELEDSPFVNTVLGHI